MPDIETAVERAEPAVMTKQRRERGYRQLVAATPAALGMLLLFVAPFVTFAVYAFLTSGAGLFEVRGPLTLSNLTGTVGSSVTRELAWNSAVVGFLAACVTLVLAFPVAYWLRYSAGRWQLPVFFLIVSAMFASYLVRIYSWRTILGEHGVLNEALRLNGITDHPLSFLLFSRFAVVTALVHIFLPYVIIMMFAAFRPLERRYLEAAQDLGASAPQRWVRVILPLVAAPAAAAFMFVFILSSSDYVTPQFLGGTHHSMIGVEIQNQFKVVGDYATGAALALLVLIAFLILYGLVHLALRLMRLQPLQWNS